MPEDVWPFSRGVAANVAAFCRCEVLDERLPPLELLLSESRRETCWTNRYYSCC